MDSLPQGPPNLPVTGEIENSDKITDGGGLDGVYNSVEDRSNSISITDGVLKASSLTFTIEWNGNVGKTNSTGYWYYEIERDGDSLLLTEHSDIDSTDRTTLEYVKSGGKSILERSMTNLDLPLTVKEITFMGYSLNGKFHITSDGALINREYGKNITIDTNVRSFYTIYHTLYYIKNDNTLWGRGKNENGILGDGTGVDRDYSVKILDNVAYIYADNQGYRAFALTTDKTLWGWGSGIYEPVKITDNVVRVYYDNGIIVLKANGLMYKYSEFKENPAGEQLSGKARNYPKTQIADFSDRFCLTPDGALLYGNFNSSWERVCDSGVVKIFNTGHFLKSDGSLWGYGENSNGELGDGTKLPRVAEPVKIADGIKDVISFAYLTANGTVWTWDRNNPTPKPSYNDVYGFMEDNVKYVMYNNGKVDRIDGGGLEAENVKLPRVINFSDPSGL
jgi:hypothetical protein